MTRITGAEQFIVGQVPQDSPSGRPRIAGRATRRRLPAGLANRQAQARWEELLVLRVPIGHDARDHDRGNDTRAPHDDTASAAAVESPVLLRCITWH